MINNSFLYRDEKLYLTVNISDIKTVDLNRLAEEYKKDYLYSANFIISNDNKLTLAYIPWDTELNLLKNKQQQKYLTQLLVIMYQAMGDLYFFDPLLSNIVIYDDKIYITNSILLDSLEKYIKHWYIFLLNILANKKYTIDTFIFYESINEYFDKNIPRKERIYWCNLLNKLDNMELVKDLPIKKSFREFIIPNYIKEKYEFHRNDIKIIYNYYLDKFANNNCEIIFLAIDLYFRTILFHEKVNLQLIYQAVNHYYNLDNQSLKLWQLLNYINVENVYYNLATTNKQLIYIFKKIILCKELIYYHINIDKLKSYFMRRKYLYQDFNFTTKLNIKTFNSLLKEDCLIY
jgi:hypothetical protein